MSPAAPVGAPVVSVIIPAHNRAATIRGAIESVLRQSYADFEILVVDDHSSDATVAAVRAIADSRIRLIAHPRNMGASAARNTGIAQARGAWIAFQDSDDEWLPLKLEKQLARLTAPGADYAAAYCGMLIVGALEADQARPADRRLGAGKARPERPRLQYVPYPHLRLVEGDILPTLLRRNVVSTQTLVARRDLLERIGGFDESFQALVDWECVIRLAQLGGFACVDEPLVLQRFSANSLSRDDSRRADAYARLIAKHHHLFAPYPAILADHYAGIASFHRKIGDHRAARAAMASARALNPLKARFWKISIRVAVRTLLGRNRPRSASRSRA